MKKVLLIVSLIGVLTIPLQAVPRDKLLHYYAGAGCGTIGYVSLRIFTWNRYSEISLAQAEWERRKISLLGGIATAAAAGAAKELVYDLAMGKGTPEWLDFGYTCLGGMTTSLATYLLDRLLIHRQKEK